MREREKKLERKKKVRERGGGGAEIIWERERQEVGKEDGELGEIKERVGTGGGGEEGRKKR